MSVRVLCRQIVKGPTEEAEMLKWQMSLDQIDVVAKSESLPRYLALCL